MMPSIKSEAVFFEEVGFRRPETYSRIDPRGPEYGRFEARVTRAATVEVSKYDGNGAVVWTASFTGWDNFRDWATDQT